MASPTKANNATEVQITAAASSRAPSPYRLAASTPAPIPHPMAAYTSTLHSEKDAPTAATAFSPRKFPATMESTML